MINVHQKLDELRQSEESSALFLRKQIDLLSTSIGLSSSLELVAPKGVATDRSHYYFVCDILFNTLSAADLLVLNNLKYHSLSLEGGCYKNSIAWGHLESIILGDFVYLELAIELVLSNERLTQSDLLTIVNTYKREIFDFRRKIKPKHLISGVSDALISRLNDRSWVRNDFRLACESKLMADEFRFGSMAATESEDDNSKNIVFLLEEVQPYFRSTVNKLILDWVYCLREYNKEYNIKILVALDFVFDGSAIPGQKSGEHVSYLDVMGALNLLTEGTQSVNFEYRPSHLPVVDWLQQKLFEQNFLAIVTFPSPRWPLLKYLKPQMPVVGVELANGVNLSDMATIVLPNGKINRDVEEKYGDSFATVDFPQVPFPVERSYTREELGFCETKHIVVSVGRHLFSRSAIEWNDYMSYVANFLEKYPDLYWVFVGESEEVFEDISYPEYKGFLENKRIRIIESEPDLMALYSVCDSFAMPPINGGGRGIGLAASAGLPCTSFSISDGSKSFPSSVVFNISDMKGYFAQVERVFLDSSYKTLVAEQCKSIFGSELFERSSKQLVSACELARNRFRRQRES